MQIDNGKLKNYERSNPDNKLLKIIKNFTRNKEFPVNILLV